MAGSDSPPSSDAPNGTGSSTPLPPPNPSPALALDGQTASSAPQHESSPSATTTPATTKTPAAVNPSPTPERPNEPDTSMAFEPVELDDFGLPVRQFTPSRRRDGSVSSQASKASRTSRNSIRKLSLAGSRAGSISSGRPNGKTGHSHGDSDSDGEFEDALSAAHSSLGVDGYGGEEDDDPRTPMPPGVTSSPKNPSGWTPQNLDAPPDRSTSQTKHGTDEPAVELTDKANEKREPPEDKEKAPKQGAKQGADHSRTESATSNTFVSEFSHQQLNTAHPDEDDQGGDEWQVMPAYAPYDIYDDDNKLVAKEHNVDDDDETYGYAGLGGAGKGYTRVTMDDDAHSATSMDDNTKYLFKGGDNTTSAMDEDDTQRDAVSQLQATKDLLTEGQRIAYVGLTRLELSVMTKEAESVVASRKTRKEAQSAAESMMMWSQKMMIRLYAHMDISPAEQVMIEQLSAHGVVPSDLTPALLANARVKNPMAEKDKDKDPASHAGEPTSPAAYETKSSPSSPGSLDNESPAEPPPPYQAHDDSELTAPVRTPSQLPDTAKIDIDLRWTVLCDLFLVLIADSVYDARSRVLLERVAQNLEIPWIDICRFEKKVTDALEMQQNAEKENWNEEDHMESRRKMALKRRYVMMGLATVGGGLVIGLSAGLLAPVIGAGLAAGFTTIGVTGTTSFLAGAGGAAIITSSAAASGSLIGVKAANRRTGAVKTFEYRPLHNNKRINLIVTVSGWMAGKEDDVRLPYSTIDPIMGDIYSVLWEPEMLTSMGDTINILATEALTQGLQQLLGSTILISLMAAVQLPVVLTKLAYLIDNPWAVSLDRATMAGLILADSLMDRNLGTRPVTLVGYSLGSRVIFSCLQELAKKNAVGLVQNVYIFGSPVVVKKDEYIRARNVVAGRFVNGYNRNDWILGYLFRLTNGGIRRVGGLAPVEGIPGLDNMDCSELVVGHMDYRTAMPRLLRECGWLVESDEFSEIEDPDPENHAERQRELINEIEEARKELEKENKSTKGAFGFFRKKKRERQEWEVYEDSQKKEKGGAGGAGGGRTEDKEGNNHGVLFDVDAIRAELAKETAGRNGEQDDLDELLQVREIPSTLPPMRLPTTAAFIPPVSPALTAREKTPEPEPPRTYSRPPYDRRDSPDPMSLHGRHMSLSHSRAASPLPLSLPTTPKPDPKPDYGSALYGHDYPTHNGSIEEDDGVQMTFDTSFKDESMVSPRSTVAKERSVSSNTLPVAGGPTPQPSTTARPEIKTAQTVPNITLSDPWADEEDEDFGKEQEISMTFA